MNWPLFFLSLDIANIVVSALLGARILRARPKQLSAQLVAIIAFNSICHIVLSRYEYGHWIPAAYQFDIGAFAPALNIIRNLTPGLFMVLSFTLFADSRHLPRWLLGLFGLQMALEISIYLPGASGEQLAQIATRVVPALLQTLFVGFALYWTIADWRSDLVETRRRSRAVVLIVIGLDMIGQSLLLRAVIAQNTIANFDAHLVFVVLNLPIVLLVLLSLSDAELAELLEPSHVQPEAVAPPPSPESEAELVRLKTLMETERIYRKASLSLKELADKVGLPEYRLRKLIHERLGYPNFNAFLHHYRIGEACRQLADPAMRRTPILTIALSTGYQSVNTFNRGFREVTGITPSEFRANAFGMAAGSSEKNSPETA